MFVVDLVRSANPTGIPVVGVAEHLKALMDKDIVYHKVSHSIGKDPEAYRQASPKSVVLPGNKTANTNGSIKDKKGVVAFPPTAVVFVVMVFVQDPQKTVHDVFVGKPGHEFHNEKCG
jgi:hypothetical protein